MPYADSVAPDQPAHPGSLTWELHCPLICSRTGVHQLISGQCSSQIRLRGWAGWSGATLSAYGSRQITSAASQGLKYWNLIPPKETYVSAICGQNVVLCQPAHQHSLTWKPHCLLISRFNPILQISGECCSQIRLRGCGGRYGATLAT